MNIETLQDGARRIWGDFPGARVRHTDTGFSAVINWDPARGLVGRSRPVYGAPFPDTGAAVIAAAWQARDNLARKLEQLAEREHAAGDIDAADLEHHRAAAAQIRDRSAVVCIVSGLGTNEHAVTFVSAYTLEGDR